MPIQLAYLSGLVSADSCMDSDSVAVLLVDKNAAKRMIIETNKTQNNLNCTDDDIRKHPDLARAAALAEIKRWVELSLIHI